MTIDAGLAARTARLAQIRTDLALEATRHVGGPGRIAGVYIDETRRGPVTINRVRVSTAEAAQAVGKPPGTYVTVEAPGLRKRNEALKETVARTVCEEVTRLANLREETKILVVGLGNWNATPDALGPRVVDHLLVTRHLNDQVPVDLRGELRSVAALSPGVLGLTGIETGDIIHAVVNKIEPDLVVAVDALASRSIERIATTIQLADTGINPGSGVGNHRAQINRESLGVPVIALGVPTVVHAFNIASDAIDLVLERLQSRLEIRWSQVLSEEERHRIVAQILSPSMGDLMVTPKEIDILINDLAEVIGAGLNAAFHPKVARQPKIV